jgi:hypothetical protein
MLKPINIIRIKTHAFFIDTPTINKKKTNLVLYLEQNVPEQEHLLIAIQNLVFFLKPNVQPEKKAEATLITE